MYDSIDNFPELLTIPDIQEILDIGRNYAYSLCRSGTLPCHKIGNKWMVSKSALKEYLHIK